MAIDTTTPRSRRALLGGALGALAATIAGLARAPIAKAGTDGDMVLETTNSTDALTELTSSGSPALRVVGVSTGLQAWGDVAVEAIGNIAVNAVSDSAQAPASIGYNRANAVGQLGWSANGNQSSPTLPANTGVMGLAEQDASARGVYGKTTSGQGVRGEATTGDGMWGEATSGRGVVGRSTSSAGVDGQSTNDSGVYGGSTNSAGVHGHGGGGPAFPKASQTGVYGTAIGSGTAINGWSESGNGVLAQSSNGLALSAVGQTGGVAAQALGDKPGVIGVSGPGVPNAPGMSGVYGEAMQVAPGAYGVVGRSSSGQGVRGESTYGIGVVGESQGGTGVRGHGSPGVLGNGSVSGSAPTAPAGTGVQGYGGAGVFGSSDQATGVIGKSGSGAPTLWAKTGVYGYAAQDALAQGVLGESTLGVGTLGKATTGQGVRGEATSGIGVKAQATTGQALIAQSTAGTAVKATGQLDGLTSASIGDRSGVVGFSGTGSAPAGPAKTGVYGEATQDSAARGVSGLSLSGQGVRGEATTGVGVKAVATTGVALDVSGRVAFSRSGKVNVPAKASSIDITVPGGLSGSAIVFAQLQLKRGSVAVVACRPNYPSAGKVRISLSGVASTTLATPLAWFVLG